MYIYFLLKIKKIEYNSWKNSDQDFYQRFPELAIQPELSQYLPR